MELRVSLKSMQQYAAIINKLTSILTECGLETEQLPEEWFTIEGAKDAEMSTSYCTTTVTAEGDYLISINEEFLADGMKLIEAPIDSIANVLPIVLPAVKAFGKKSTADMQARFAEFTQKWEPSKEPAEETTEEPAEAEDFGTTFEDLEALEKKDEGDEA